MKRTYTKDKEYSFNVRFSRSEYEDLSRIAYSVGLPMADVVRCAIRSFDMKMIRQN